MTEIALREQHEIITADTITSYMDSFNVASNLTDTEKQQFIKIATAYQLNPFKREIYCTPYMTNIKQEDGTWKKERKLSIITGYEVYLKRAERSGKLNGWKVEIIGEAQNRKAQITIHRKDWNNPLVHDVFYSEYIQDNKMWKEKPLTMLKKVAMAQGFRLAFPDEMSGMPYAAEELPDNMTPLPETEPEKTDAGKHTPDVLKNPKGEIELPEGDHVKIMQELDKVKTEKQLKFYYDKRAKFTWTTEQIAEQDKFVAELKKRWEATA